MFYGYTRLQQEPQQEKPLQAHLWHRGSNFGRSKGRSILEDQLRVNLDCLDEVRDKASQKMVKHQQKMAECYDKRVKLRRLNIGDLVLHKVTPATKDPTQGKLGPTWEGPYKVISYSRQGNHHLETMDRKKLLQLRNIEHLKKYHQ